jgi:hypothetical protein
MTEEDADEYLMTVPYSKSDGLATMSIPMKMVQQLFEECHGVSLPMLSNEQMSKIRTDFHDAVQVSKKLGFFSLLRTQFLFVQICKRLHFDEIARFHDSIRPGNLAYDGLMVCWKKICQELKWN